MTFTDTADEFLRGLLAVTERIADLSRQFVAQQRFDERQFDEWQTLRDRQLAMQLHLAVRKEVDEFAFSTPECISLWQQYREANAAVREAMTEWRLMLMKQGKL